MIERCNNPPFFCIILKQNHTLERAQFFYSMDFSLVNISFLIIYSYLKNFYKKHVIIPTYAAVIESNKYLQHKTLRRICLTSTEFKLNFDQRLLRNL